MSDNINIFFSGVTGKNLICMLNSNENTIKTWKYWCNKNKVDFVLSNNEEIDFKLLEKYDKIGLVSNQTMIKWNAKNVFDEFETDDFCGVLDTINFKKIYDEVKDYKNFDISKYINTDVLFFGKKHIGIFRDLDIPINQSLQKNNISVKELTQNWNLGGLVERHFLSYNWQLKENKTSFFIKYGDIWNLTNVNSDLKNQIWKVIGGQYK